MKRPRTKKLRGGKRKLAAPEKVENSQKPALQQQKGQDTNAAKVIQRAAVSKGDLAMQAAAKSAQAARETNNVLKTKGDARANASNETTTDSEVERWISLIREGGLDRKVQVKGRTGALLVR